MELLADAMSGLGAALLPVAAVPLLAPAVGDAAAAELEATPASVIAVGVTVTNLVTVDDAALVAAAGAAVTVVVMVVTITPILKINQLIDEKMTRH